MWQLHSPLPSSLLSATPELLSSGPPPWLCISDAFSGVATIYLKLSMRNRKITTCNQLDLKQRNQSDLFDWEPVTIDTFQALIGGKGRGGPSSLVHITLEGPTEWVSMWMQDGCKVYMDSYVASNGSCVHAHLDYFQKPPLGGRANTKPRHHGTPNAHNRLFHSISSWVRTHVNCKFIEIAFVGESGHR